MADGGSRRVAAGVALIVLGVGLFFLQRFDERITGSALLLLIGGTFLAAYLYRREYGFLIPGCILLGLGLGGVADRLTRLDEPELLGLGLGFVAIWAVALLYQGRSHWWPLIPGGVLILIALGSTREVMEFLFDHWPLALVVIGVVILLGGLRPRR